MIRRIIDFSLDNRLLVLVLWLIAAIIGLRSLGDLPIDAVPDVTNVQVQVLTNTPGLAPEEVERFITFPVETAMSGLPRIEEIRSVSKFGLSVVTVVFEEGTDIYWGRQVVSERLAGAREMIPDSYGGPEMGPISTGLGEIYQFEVRGDGYTPMQLREILDWNINFNLRSVPGVVEVNSFGGELKTYQVTVDPEQLTARGLSIGEVFRAIAQNNSNVGGGYIAHAGEQYLIRGEGLVGSLADLANIVVAVEPSGAAVFLSHLAKIEFAPMIRQGAATRDGEREAVVGIVMMLMGANSRTVSAAVHEKVQELQKTLPAGVSIDTFYDRTELVDRTIETVAWNLTEGGILVIVVLLCLLGSLRGGLLVASSIPLSMLLAFIAMRLCGISGNLMSLGAIDFGIIVDGAVVVVENIVRYCRKHKDDRVTPHLEKVRRACHEVTRPVVFALGIIIIVYLPILALRGIEGKMFRPMALTVVFALLGSLACALTLMPVLATWLLVKPLEKEPVLFRWARRIYEPLLAAVIRRPRPTALAAAGFFGASLVVAPFLGAVFIPRLDEGAIAMQIWRIPSISLKRSNEVSLEAERIVKRFPEVRTVVSRTGRAEIATDPMGVEISDTYLMLEPHDTWRFERKEDLVEAIKAALEAEIPGVLFSFSQPIELRVQELIAGVRSDVAAKVFAAGGDLARMKEVARDVAAVMRGVRGLQDVKVEQTVGLPQLRITVDREACARLGVNARDVLDVVEAVGGKPVGTVFEGQKRFVLQVRYGESTRADLASLQDLKVAAPLPTGDQVLVPLAQLASIRVEEGVAQISRERISRRITVEANVRGRDLASAVTEARRAVDEHVEVPPGWTIEWGGQFKNLKEASQRLALLVPLALLLIFVILYSTFASAKLAFFIYLNVPLALTGGIAALVLRGYPFSISAGVGFIALFGIAVMNGVVLVSAMTKLSADGASPVVAAREAALIRLRPVLMTALTDIIGFGPMAIATSAGAEVQRPLATVVIGGLLTSMVLTLLVLPALYPRLVKTSAPTSGKARQ